MHATFDITRDLLYISSGGFTRNYGRVLDVNRNRHCSEHSFLLALETQKTCAHAMEHAPLPI